MGELYKTFHELDTNGNGAVSWTEFQLALQDLRGWGRKVQGMRCVAEDLWVAVVEEDTNRGVDGGGKSGESCSKPESKIAFRSSREFGSAVGDPLCRRCDKH